MRISVSASISGLLTLAGALLAPALAQAHVSVVSGPAFANTTQEITFGIGHGCAGVDTYSVTIEIPAGVSSVRALGSTLGRPTLTRDDAQNVKSITWQKPDGQQLANDDDYYKLTIRAKIPDQPFTTLYFVAHQTCRTPEGVTTSVDWAATMPTQAEDAGMAEPAPSVTILPARRPGWNKITVPVALASLSPLFDDALIVWKGNAAFSANPATAEQIAGTQGVSALTALAAGDVIWVKY